MTQTAIVPLTPEAVAAQLTVAAKQPHSLNFYQEVERLKDQSALLAKTPPELFINGINDLLAQELTRPASKLLDILKCCPAVFAAVLQSLPGRIIFPKPHDSGTLAFVLRDFSDYPQLHAAIHKSGAEAGMFARLLTNKPKDRNGHFQAVALQLTEQGFMAQDLLASTIGLYDAPLNKILAEWVTMRFPNREIWLNDYLPEVVSLMREAAACTTLPQNLREVAEREIIQLRDFMKPRGITI